MSEIYHYITDLPDGLNEAVLVCPDGYTIYTDSSLSREETIKAFFHALSEHIYNDDFYNDYDADYAELRAHESQ